MVKSKLQRLKEKCEHLAIEKKLEKNKRCLACGGLAITCHHFFPKSISAYLRCDQRNLIPICFSCHFAHHKKSNPKIHQTIIKKLGLEWYESLRKDSVKRIKDNIHYWSALLKSL